MPGMTRRLGVPYFVQPTGITCQSTVLKMFASHLERSVVLQSTGAGERQVIDIWKDINEDPRRPSKVRNAHANMKWWLERHFPTLRFQYLQITNQIEDQALFDPLRDRAEWRRAPGRIGLGSDRRRRIRLVHSNDARILTRLIQRPRPGLRMRRREYPAASAAMPQVDLISIFFCGFCACAVFGSVIVSTPFEKSAETLLRSTLAGKSNAR